MYINLYLRLFLEDLGSHKLWAYINQTTIPKIDISASIINRNNEKLALNCQGVGKIDIYVPVAKDKDNSFENEVIAFHGLFKYVIPIIL
ncbi:hypothetical protein [Staphylococcus pseudoxylosus]|uniref:hypothetical protein n=1 Tax=Staphylococcus pseudoxylosus TaxID=2282419 RepID=UPI00398B6873